LFNKKRDFTKEVPFQLPRNLFSFALAISVDNFAFAGIFALIGAIQGVLFPVGSMLIADHIKPSRNVTRKLTLHDGNRRWTGNGTVDYGKRSYSIWARIQLHAISSDIGNSNAADHLAKHT